MMQIGRSTHEMYRFPVEYRYRYMIADFKIRHNLRSMGN